MPTSRRNFLRVAAASGTYVSFPLHFQALLAAEYLHAKLAADPLRPKFHLLPVKNWMNDQNGPIYWKGRYHMFFQYNPHAAVWGDMHWAHAVSDDMKHWRHLPIALAPTPGWDDSDSCFTGSAVDNHGTTTILYTGAKSVPAEHATLRDAINNFREVQCLATSTDPQLRTWMKWKQPVIEPPDDPKLTGFRDPFLLRDGNEWLLGVASGHFKKGGCVLLYRSKDLRTWGYLHELASGRWSEKESVAELIVDRRHAITSRIYRQPDGSLRIKPNGEDLLSLVSLDAWELRPISPIAWPLSGHRKVLPLNRKLSLRLNVKPSAEKIDFLRNIPAPIHVTLSQGENHT
jgi:hypothetical protein